MEKNLALENSEALERKVFNSGLQIKNHNFCRTGIKTEANRSVCSTIFCKTSFFFQKSPSMGKSQNRCLDNQFFYRIMQSNDFICRTKIAEGLGFGLGKKISQSGFFESLGNRRRLFHSCSIVLFDQNG